MLILTNDIIIWIEQRNNHSHVLFYANEGFRDSNFFWFSTKFKYTLFSELIIEFELLDLEMLGIVFKVIFLNCSSFT